MTVHRFRHHPLVGTVVEAAITTADDTGHAAAAINRALVTEMARLEAIFSAFDADSELRRWTRGDIAEPSPEFCTVMAAALSWQATTAGRFNPMASLVSDRWKRAEADGIAPEHESLAALAAAIAEPRFELRDGCPVPVADCDGLQLNALAKGFIVDAAGDHLVASFPAMTSLVVNAGGDLRHWGDGSHTVGIENPRRPYDNEPPLAQVDIASRALATSGGARKGFRVGGTWYSHLLDPRTARPADTIASISVVASDAMTADVLATSAAMLEAAEAVEALASVPQTAVMVVDGHGRAVTTPSWDRLAAR